MKATYFVDFDGTITMEDTATAMTRAFVRIDDIPSVREINNLWEQKKISTRECARRVFSYFQADPDDVFCLLEGIEIDPGFMEFTDLCLREQNRIYVLSDGFDLSIRTVFRKYGINVPYFSNTMTFDNRFSIECPYANCECGHCGVCKTSLMQRLKEPGQTAIYIGDGYSDVCPAKHADMVFAKDPLYSLCRTAGVNVVGFSTFSDIITMLSEIPDKCT